MESETVYTVTSIGSGTSYHGTDEALADAAWDRCVELVDTDTTFQPLCFLYQIDGRTVQTHKSITFGNDPAATETRIKCGWMK